MSPAAVAGAFAVFVGVVSPAVGQEKKLVHIDFFGHDGVDTEALRRALPFRAGDAVPGAGFEAWKSAVRRTAVETAARESTDQAFVCCYEGGWVAYFGLRGASVADPKVNGAPAGAVRLSPEFMSLDAEFNRAWVASVVKGDRAALDAAWQAMRELAPRHERTLLEAGTQSADPAHRSAAVFALGHAMEPSEARLAVLLEAAYDPDSTVRNNAVRGLGEWARQAPAWRARIPARIAIDLVRSGVWSDRNKGASLLRELTESRDESVLAEIRAVALPALREMAQWRWFGHNSDARAVLDRIR